METRKRFFTNHEFEFLKQLRNLTKKSSIEENKRCTEITKFNFVSI